MVGHLKCLYLTYLNHLETVGEEEKDYFKIVNLIILQMVGAICDFCEGNSC